MIARSLQIGCITQIRENRVLPSISRGTDRKFPVADVLDIGNLCAQWESVQSVYNDMKSAGLEPSADLKDIIRECEHAQWLSN